MWVTYAIFEGSNFTTVLIIINYIITSGSCIWSEKLYCTISTLIISSLIISVELLILFAFLL